jgi:predicted phage baseplate assembly protein
VKIFVNGSAQQWEEQSDLIESKSDARHFIVETDEYGVSAIRFGNNINGLALPAEAEATCWYQVGRGSTGNVGADTLTSFDRSFAAIQAVWNPFDVINGRDLEEPEVIIRRTPEAYRARQLRAVTLNDYVKRAEELPDVSHAYASYAWTGSWRTVRVAIDPVGATLLSNDVRERVESHLDAVRLIGEDLEVRGARYVALDIMLSVCADPEFWPEDLTSVLEMEFSDGYTPDGRPGFFHPDLWTFGRPLHASQLIGRALSITGVERVLTVSMRRWNAGFGPSPTTITVNPEDLPEAVVLTLAVEPYEIIQVANDPNHLEHGRIQFDIWGGRQ